ncbi:MAG: glycosyltransferase family 4 protein, partial [Verrucomicrobiota bacterium]
MTSSNCQLSPSRAPEHISLNPRGVTQKNVLLVGNFFSSSMGARGVCEDLAEQLAGNGWTVYSTSLKKNRAARLFDMVTTVWRLRRKYGVAHVDVYSGAAFIWAEAACWTLRRAKKPYVLTLHGGDLPEFSRRWHGRVARLLRSAEVVTSPSRYLRDQMRSYRDDLQLMPNPLDLKQYPFRLREAPKPNLVWLRAFHSIYNPSLAPRVIAELAKEFPNLRLTMIGPDKGDGSLQETQRVAGEKGVANHITFVGGVPKSEVPGRLSDADIFLNTTNVDNTPVSVLEAMACGLCVVNTNVVDNTMNASIEMQYSRSNILRFNRWVFAGSRNGDMVASFFGSANTVDSNSLDSNYRNAEDRGAENIIHLS